MKNKKSIRKTLIISFIVIVISILIPLFIDESLNEKIEEINLRGTKNTTIFIIDGITGTPTPYTDFSKYFNSLGYNVRVPILKNHGNKLSLIRKTKISEIEEQLRTQINGINGNVVMIGISSGALLALELSNGLNKSAILINIPLESIPNEVRYLSFLPYVYRFDMGLLKNNTELKKVPRYNKYPISLLIDENKYSKNINLSTNNQLLIIQSKNDIRAKGAEKLVSLAPNSKLIYLYNSGHLAYLDIEKDKVYKEIENFIE